jgi:hypothetical protein
MADSLQQQVGLGVRQASLDNESHNERLRLRQSIVCEWQAAP